MISCENNIKKWVFFAQYDGQVIKLPGIHMAVLVLLHKTISDYYVGQ